MALLDRAQRDLMTNAGDIRTWLAGQGLAKYSEAFASNDIDLDVLPELSFVLGMMPGYKCGSALPRGWSLSAISSAKALTASSVRRRMSLPDYKRLRNRVRW